MCEDVPECIAQWYSSYFQTGGRSVDGSSISDDTMVEGRFSHVAHYISWSGVYPNTHPRNFQARLVLYGSGLWVGS